MYSKYNNKSQKAFRRKLRKSATIPEKILWTKLKGRQLEGRKFRRQAGFGKYIADFYCPSENLVIELDGAYHKSNDRKIYEQERDAYFATLGIKVLHIPNFTGNEALKITLQLITSQFDSKSDTL